MTWRDAIETAVQRLAGDTEHQRLLRVFVDHFGMDSYTPPPQVEESVRNIVHGLLACAAALNKESGRG
ncbi:MAG: hypothetical protein ACK4S2_07125 [Gemmobacter sp.]|uniref:hypothetical protein n=1 Tax=Gemmobacter sp. TaxID=1898957 RepID=UPI003918C8EA